MTVSITTSWDDGHVLDLRVAEILDRHGLKGTFYIARDFLDERMSVAELRDLAQRHEIGAHTLTHPLLTEISLQQATVEIKGSKQWLEDILGQEVTAFCYPKGGHNRDLQDIVAQAGYKMARTVDKFALQIGENPFAIPTTMQVYPYPLRPLEGISWLRGWGNRLQPLREALTHRHLFTVTPGNLINWSNLAETILRSAEKEAGVWHLWGHSWEIERYDLWDAFERVCANIRHRTGAQFATNTQLVDPRSVIF